MKSTAAILLAYIVGVIYGLIDLDTFLDQVLVGVFVIIVLCFLMTIIQ
jgi:hypothetical protein